MVTTGFLSIFVNLPPDEENKKRHGQQEDYYRNKDVFARQINQATKGKRDKGTD